MLSSNLKILLRHIKKHKFVTFLSMMGLTIGMTCYMLIFQYVSYEFSYEDFHRKKDNIYKLERVVYDGDKHTVSTSNPIHVSTIPFEESSNLKKVFPEIQEMARLSGSSRSFIIYGNKMDYEKIYQSEPSIFKVFSFHFIKGDINSALKTLDTAVISESISKKYFGDENPIGKQFVVTSLMNVTYTVTGVYSDMPKNTHLSIDILTTIPEGSWFYNPKTNNYRSYLLLKPGTNTRTLVSKLTEYTRKKKILSSFPISSQWNYSLIPLKDIHLYGDSMGDKPNGDRSIVYFFLIVAFLILSISWVNYINITTTRMMERAKEAGIRKVMGSSPFRLFKRFLFETLMINLIPMALTVDLCIVLTPFLRHLTGQDIPMPLAGNMRFVLHLLGVYIMGSFLSGLYPAIKLASVSPISILNRSRWLHTLSGSRLKKSLLIFQFMISSLLIITSLTVYRQTEYMIKKDIGINIHKVICIKAPLFSLGQEYLDGALHILIELSNHPGIKSISGSSIIPGDISDINQLIWKPNTDGYKDGKLLSVNLIDAGFLPLFESKLLAGRNFSSMDYPVKYAIINETALKLLGFSRPEDAINKTFSRGTPNAKVSDPFMEVKIIGVVKDYHQQSLKNSISPILFLNQNGYMNYFSVRVNKELTDINRALSVIKGVWKKHYHDYPMGHFMLEDAYFEQYEMEIRLGKLLGIFVFIAIIINSMGLLSLSYFNAMARVKEIGIRKTFGGTASNIINLMQRDNFKLIAISVVIAWPIAFFIIKNWLESFAYHIPIPWVDFLISGIIVCLFSLLASFYHSWTASRLNPLDAIREE